MYEKLLYFPIKNRLNSSPKAGCVINNLAPFNMICPHNFVCVTPFFLLGFCCHKFCCESFERVRQIFLAAARSLTNSFKPCCNVNNATAILVLVTMLPALSCPTKPLQLKILAR